MFNWLTKRRSTPEQAAERERQAEAYAKGQEFGAQLFEAFNAYITDRIAPVKARYLDVLRGRMKLIFDDPEQDPALVARIEYDIFAERLPALEADFRQEARRYLAEWLEIADTIGSGDDTRAALDELIRREIEDLKISGMEVLIEDGGGAILEEKEKPKRLIPRGPKESERNE